MRCGRCEALICGKCAVSTVVGTRCQGCSPSGPQTVNLADRAPGLSPALRNGIFFALVAVVAVSLGYSWVIGDYDKVIVGGIVFGGSLASMVVHEFAHGLVAYLGGDRSIRQRGMLTLNPLRYIDPIYSLVIPMVFLLMGGIPLIGGRTLVHSHSLRSKWWDSAVSAAGPISNLAIAVAIAAYFQTSLPVEHPAVSYGLGYLAVLQVAMFLFNVIPLPPFDGFGMIAPHLTPEARARGYEFGRAGYFLVLAVFWMVPEVGNRFWDGAYAVTEFLRIHPWWSFYGWELSRFHWPWS